MFALYVNRKVNCNGLTLLTAIDADLGSLFVAECYRAPMSLDTPL